MFRELDDLIRLNDSHLQMRHLHSVCDFENTVHNILGKTELWGVHQVT